MNEQNDDMMKTGVEMIQAERDRQLQELNHTPDRDDTYANGQLASVASIYAKYATSEHFSEGLWLGNMDAAPTGWPWRDGLWNPTTPKRMLIKAGALIAAELDRLQRIELRAEAARSTENTGWAQLRNILKAVAKDGVSAIACRPGDLLDDPEVLEGWKFLSQRLAEAAQDVEVSQALQGARSRIVVHAEAELSELDNDPELRSAWRELERIHANRKEKELKEEMQA